MTKYILMVLAGAVSFGILSSFVKIAYQQGYSPAEISFSQAFTGALLLWLLARIVSPGFSVRSVGRRQIAALLGTGATIGLATFYYYVSVHYIPASLAIVLLMQFTWMGLLFDWLFFRKRPSLMEAGISAVIIGGTVLAGNLWGNTDFHVSWTGIFYVLLASVLYAGYIVANSRAGKHMPNLTKSAWIMTGSALAIGLVNLPSLATESHLGFALGQWALFLALFGTVIPPVLFAKGIPHVGAGISGILMTAELPVAVITAHFLLGEQLTTTQLIGIVIMLGAIIAMNRYRVRKVKPVAAN
ncbi:EamA family transporter [Arsenicibacter rosenii]|uniref:EamA domain-containing protein n=1 Tax=Arsenicibacter rosenii TaxID=1750698 RepID=A0A1S2VNJ2_9BACT|nr:DMT family transporter [Arsenicibacter rosenii]OIN59358.1 hypothetical protein BLX24_10290 [Arsenicibacter rosenii]